MIQLTCSCGKVLQAPPHLAGKQVRCPGCQTILTVPAAAAEDRTAVLPGEAPAPPPPPPPVPPTEQIQAGDVPRRKRRDELDLNGDDRRPRRAAGKTSGKAITSLVLGLLSFPCCGVLLTGLPAILFGLLALRDIGRSGGALGGKVLAIFGMLLGTVGCLAGCGAGVGAALLYPTFEEARAKAESRRNLMQIGLALHTYHDTETRLPPNNVMQGQPVGLPAGAPKGLSWRVAVLPYLEQENVYRQVNLREPWDGPTNRRLGQETPKIFQVPGKPAPPGMTYYQVFVTPRNVGGWQAGTAFPAAPPGVRFIEFTDGTSNTIMVVEMSKPVPWMAPDDPVYDPNGPLPALGVYKGGFNAVMGDGAVRWVPAATPPNTIKGAITRAGGEVITLPGGF